MFKDLLERLKVWAPPLIGIPAMLLLGYWSDIARFFLFTHHLFWMVGIFLLINPIAETFWPSPASGAQKGRGWRAPPQPSAKARARREARKRMAKQQPASETPAERLTRLQKQKEALDQKIEQLTTQDKKH